MKQLKQLALIILVTDGYRTLTELAVLGGLALVLASCGVVR